MKRTISTRRVNLDPKKIAKLEEVDDEVIPDDGEPIYFLVQKGLPSLDYKRGSPKKKNNLTEVTIDALKNEPSLWFRIGDGDKLKVLNRMYGSGPYLCFSIHDETDAPCPELKNIHEACNHLNSCIKPMYFTYMEPKVALFRALDVKLRARYIKEALHSSDQIPCLACSKNFGHHYGLTYHLERCNVDEHERPWKCYRCGFTSTQDNADEHLNECGNENETVLKREVNELFSEGTPVDENGSPAPGSSLAALLAGRSAADSPSSFRRRRNRVSLAAGVMPTESARVRVSNSGALRFRFRKSEITAIPPCVRDWVKYTDFVSKSSAATDNVESNQDLCECLKEIKSRVFEKEDAASFIDVNKTSVNFKHVPSSNNSPEDSFPPGSVKLRLYGTTSIVPIESGNEEFTEVAYVGGPVHTLKFAPNKLSDNEEVFLSINHACDTELITQTWKEDSGFCQLWRVSTDPATKKPCLKLWFVLRSEFGAILTGTWLDRRTGKDESLVGYLALGTAQGVILIYKISKDSAPISKEANIFMTSPKPDVILSQQTPTLKKQDDENQTSQYPPPIIRIAWCIQGLAQFIVGINGAGSILTWDLTSSYDIPKLLREPEWSSPAIDACFKKGYEVAVAFRERIIRVFDIRSWECLMEENTVRTAGSRVTSEPRCFPGLISFQSEYAAIGDVQATGLAYISTDVQAQGYFVVPLANSHFLQTWDVAISPINGVVASCGADGQLQASAHGKMAAYMSKIDCPFSLKKTSLSLTRKRLVPASESESKIRESIIKHHDICENLWLEIKLDNVKDGSDIEYSCIDSRIESLNALTANKFGTPIVICGGQAGLLFCRPLNFESDGDVFGKGFRRK